MRVLITGISGFVGKNLTKYLMNLQDIQIVGLDVTNERVFGVEKIFLWNNLNVIPDVDIIVHLAGKAHDTENSSNENEYFNVNYGLTKKIYDYFLSSKASKFFFISSVKAVADFVNISLDEHVLPNPMTAYGKSKRMAEQYILDHNTNDDKFIYIFRPCMIYGPGNKGNLNLLSKVVSKGLPWPLGSFENKRSLLSIENMCFVFNEFFKNKFSSGIYNLSDDEPISTNELIEIISKVKRKKLKIWRIPSSIIRMVANIGSVIGLPLNNERFRKLTENYVVSNKKLLNTIKKELPVKTKVGLAEILINM